MTAFYPTKDGQPVEIVKEKIQEDLQRLGSDEKTKEPKHLTFYHSEEAEAPFVGYHPIQIKRSLRIQMEQNRSFWRNCEGI